MRRVLAIVGLLALGACDEGKVNEIARYPSPVGGLDAVVGRMSAGEADPFLVVLTKPGEAPGKGARLFLADHTDAPVVEWADAEHLTIRCDNARVWSFRNFWTSPNKKQVTVSIRLECGREGWTP
ncbi:MAG: hypothetical protein H7Y60_16605 [Rhodospirillaceae bacterium]|nr:hypothetical protein [Rhodospirillales bacterium]